MVFPFRVRPPLLWLGLLLLLGCDERCNTLDCDTLFNDCDGVLKAEPHYARCGLSRADDDTFSDYVNDRAYRCAQACVASNSGKALECVSESRNSCRSGNTASVLNSCAARLPSTAPACVQKCDATRETCESACPQPSDSKSKCLDCVARCGLAWGRCEAACREDDR